MTLFWALLAALGLALVLSGLPIGSRSGLRHRVEPYLGGAQIRRSSARPTPRWDRWHPLVSRWPSGRDPSGRLRAAGTGLSVDAFRLEQIAWGFACALVVTGGAAALQLTQGGLDLRVLPLLTVILFGVGYLGRDWWLTQEVERRHARLLDELPAAIDLMTLSIMAGESVQAACARVAEAIPEGIGEEFAHVTADVRTGTSIVEALEGLARRLPAVGVGRFVDALCVGIEKGAPLADTLRAQADDGREARRRRLLEIGGRREVLMLVPVVFLIMPVVVVFALYPGLVTLDLLVP